MAVKCGPAWALNSGQFQREDRWPPMVKTTDSTSTNRQKHNKHNSPYVTTENYDKPPPHERGERKKSVRVFLIRKRVFGVLEVLLFLVPILSSFSIFSFSCWRCTVLVVILIYFPNSWWYLEYILNITISFGEWNELQKHVKGGSHVNRSVRSGLSPALRG